MYLVGLSGFGGDSGRVLVVPRLHWRVAQVNLTNHSGGFEHRVFSFLKILNHLVL